jgi:D-alanine-D-alanine ligase
MNKPLRILALVHKHLVPPEDTTRIDLEAAEWKTEHDVTTTLHKCGHEVKIQGVQKDLAVIAAAIEEFKPDIVFNLLEAFDDVTTFDQNVVSYLELIKMPYTGCNPRGLMLARDKSLSKELLAYHRIPVPDFTVIRRGRKPVLTRKLRYPVIVKSLFFEASAGISQASVVENDEQLAKRVQFIHDSLGTAAIVEQFIDGRELYVGAMGNERVQVFPIWEMSFSKMPGNTWRIATERVKWNTRYQERHGIETGKADLPEELAARVQHLVKRAYRVLDLSGYARLDLRLDSECRPFVIEANPNPQLAEGEDFAESGALAGLSYEKLLERIVGLGLQWQPERTG